MGRIDVSAPPNDVRHGQHSRDSALPAPERGPRTALDPRRPAPGRQDAALAVEWAAALAGHARRDGAADATSTHGAGSQLDGAVTLLDRHEVPGYVADLIEHAHSEVLFLLAGPAQPEDQDDRLIEATLRAATRGVRFTSTWSPDLLATYAARVGEQLRAVGRIRQSADLPTRMIVVDGHTAVLPLDAGDLAQGALAVRTPALRHLVTGLIEEVYDDATPPVHGARPSRQAH
ncbi:hypothetical protein [Pseudofrankia inefficax]|uniref:hypothetical protein n=1 Tax=Pseudofrankia inefficax (strain DSM 45817 / CECT 9037 / DDB 130130 / EuI1c) TaxID=298654 RepID=UPI0001BFA974|nr:hypothetical protein [Pseudofrankia inefficax]